MIYRIKFFIYNWLYFKKHKEKIGISLKEFRRLKKYKANYIRDETVSFFGKRVQLTSPYWFLHSIEEIFIDEVYKYSPAKKDVLIIDCGANIGLSILYFKKICPEARVLAFEADPHVFQILENNIKSFNLIDIELVNNAVWIENTKLEFNAEGTVGGRLGLGETEMKNKVQVKTIRLRDYLDNKVDFLKIDIEGAEYLVLKDCVDKLRNVENLFIEYHVLNEEEQHLEEILFWVKQVGFRYYIKQASENQKHPFLSMHGEYYEMQLNIFCYRK